MLRTCTTNADMKFATEAEEQDIDGIHRVVVIESLRNRTEVSHAIPYPLSAHKVASVQVNQQYN
jgi:hypothetical protein